MARIKRRRVSPRFYLFLCAAVVAVVAAVLLWPMRRSGTLSAGSQKVYMQATAVLIRDEVSSAAEKYDRVRYQVLEGAQVNAEMPVAVVYKWGYTDEMTQSLLAVQQQIYKKQVELLGSAENAELSSVNTQIIAKEAAIRASVRREPIGEEPPGDLLALENDLQALMQQRMALLKQGVQPDESLNALYAEETTRQTQLAEYTSDMIAKGSGVVSFYFDGYEQVLMASKLDVVSAGLLNNVIAGAASGAAASSEIMLYRLVNPTRWYLAFVTPRSQALRLAQGQAYTVELELDNAEGKLYTGTALAPSIYENGVVNMLEFAEDMGDLIGVRTAHVTLSAQVSGFKLPLKAIKLKEGAPVLSTQGGEIPLDVLSVEGDTAIVQAQDGAGLYAGQKYDVN
ncbi:MAG: hypothetical protein LBN26_06260 [Christensenellaceae bacterium]|jgi:hypothetical protein|nr:hypothetical protein [Christensenellaceae bacterium]